MNNVNPTYFECKIQALGQDDGKSLIPPNAFLMFQSAMEYSGSSETLLKWLSIFGRAAYLQYL